MRALFAPASGLLAVIALAGCDFQLPTVGAVVPSDGNTVGDLGRLELAYAGPSGSEACSSGCNLGMPLMSGDSEAITVGPHAPAPLPALAFSSSDPGVLTVSPAVADGASPWERATTLTGVGVGSAVLSIRDADTQALIDTTTVRVAAAASLAVAFQINGTASAPVTGSALTLDVGQEATPSFTVLGGGAEALAGWNGVTLQVGAAGVVSLERANDLFLTADAAGTTTLTAVAGTVTQQIHVVVH